MLWLLIRSAPLKASNEYHNICFQGEIRNFSVEKSALSDCDGIKDTLWIGPSNEYHNICFCGEMRKISGLSCSKHR